MYITKKNFDKIQYPILHDAMHLISLFDDTKSIHSLYVDPKGGACLEFDSVLSQEALMRVCVELYPCPQEFVDRCAEDVILLLPASDEECKMYTYLYEYVDGKTMLYTPEEFDVRK